MVIFWKHSSSSDLEVHIGEGRGWLTADGPCLARIGRVEIKISVPQIREEGYFCALHNKGRVGGGTCPSPKSLTAPQLETGQLVLFSRDQSLQIYNKYILLAPYSGQ